MTNFLQDKMHFSSPGLVCSECQGGTGMFVCDECAKKQDLDVWCFGCGHAMCVCPKGE